jgi:hypothetical protein
MFISRGRGRGHASPDIEIARELNVLLPDADLKFVSYSTGADTLRNAGYQPIDLDLPEQNPFFETLVRITQVANDFEPDFLIAHEEFSAPVCAKILGVPCLFITDWFPPLGSSWLEALSQAEKIIFMDEAGLAEEPTVLKRKIDYLGPMTGRLRYSKADRRQVRQDLGLPLELPVILVAPGGSLDSSEERSPIFQLVMSAVRALPFESMVLWILSKDEQSRLRGTTKVPNGVVFMEPHRGFDRTMVAADIAITKGTRKTNFELNALDIPSISLTYGHNPVDDWRVPRISTNVTLHARTITPEQLSHQISNALLRSETSSGYRSLSLQNGCHEAANSISAWIRLSREIEPMNR